MPGLPRLSAELIAFAAWCHQLWSGLITLADTGGGAPLCPSRRGLPFLFADSSTFMPGALGAAAAGAELIPEALSEFLACGVWFPSYGEYPGDDVGAASGAL